jgi:hypothetical protein
MGISATLDRECSYWKQEPYRSERSRRRPRIRRGLCWDTMEEGSVSSPLADCR